MSILISHESPLQLLEKSLEYNDYQYILPFFYKRYPKYKEFMDNFQGMKILDNGLFEGETYTIQEQIQLIKDTNCTIYIVQDEWNNSTITAKNAKYWMGLKKSGVLDQKLNLLVVLQGKSFSEIELLYQQCVDLGYRHFAFNHSSISYENEIKGDYTKDTRAKVGRIQLIRQLWNKNIIKQDHWIHLLGAMDITEFSYYNQALPGIINSIDTSSPIIKGIEDGLYTEENMKVKISTKMEEYFEDELSTGQEFRILENIKIFKNLVNNK